MNDLLKKLNVLIRSNLNDALEGGSSARPRAPLGRDLENQIAALRIRIDDALAYEETVRRRLRELDDEIAQWDAQADRAVEAGDEAGGRYSLQQMRRAEQRRVSSEHDLRQYQSAAEALIGQVDELEAYVNRQTDRVASAPQERVADENPPRDLAATPQSRETPARTPLAMPPSALPDEPQTEEAINQDLERRRQRLSKPPTGPA